MEPKIENIEIYVFNEMCSFFTFCIFILILINSQCDLDRQF